MATATRGRESRPNSVGILIHISPELRRAIDQRVATVAAETGFARVSMADVVRTILARELLPNGGGAR